MGSDDTLKLQCFFLGPFRAFLFCFFHLGMGVENQQQTNFPKRESQIDERGMDVCMDGWMDDDGWHSLNPNQNNSWMD
jgi:hypothetical protein